MTGINGSFADWASFDHHGLMSIGKGEVVTSSDMWNFITHLSPNLNGPCKGMNQ